MTMSELILMDAPLQARGPVTMEDFPLLPTIGCTVFFNQVQLHRELADLSFERRYLSYSDMTLASASSSLSSPRSNCVSHSWMRLAQTPKVRWASRRPITPFRMSWQSCNLNGVECRR
jgi:hypothetical protein